MFGSEKRLEARLQLIDSSSISSKAPFTIASTSGDLNSSIWPIHFIRNSTADLLMTVGLVPKLTLHEPWLFRIKASPELDMLLPINHHNLHRAASVTAQSTDQGYSVAKRLQDQPSHGTLYGISNDQHPIPLG